MSSFTNLFIDARKWFFLQFFWKLMGILACHSHKQSHDFVTLFNNRAELTKWSLESYSYRAHTHLYVFVLCVQLRKNQEYVHLHFFEKNDMCLHSHACTDSFGGGWWCIYTIFSFHLNFQIYMNEDVVVRLDFLSICVRE